MNSEWRLNSEKVVFTNTASKKEPQLRNGLGFFSCQSRARISDAGLPEDAGNERGCQPACADGRLTEVIPKSHGGVYKPEEPDLKLPTSKLPKGNKKKDS
jgi:hypothetical protein